MKFNLKNRPIFESDPMHIGDRFVEAKELEKWFEGFEKELREDADRLKKSREEADYHTTMVINSLLRWIMEILGETNSEG